MPLDTGGVTNLHLPADWDRDPGVAESYMPTLESAPDIGVALKTAREFRGLSLQDVADQTRIRRAYLAAIEEMRLDELPSRPFTIGYVRAYATALGLDAEAAVERFKADEPAPDEPLRAPVGVRRDGDPRLMSMVVFGLLVVGAIVLWNIAQRAMNEQAPPPSTAPADVAAPVATASGPVSLGAPLPAPVESTTPTPYVTPGLEAAAAASGSADAVDAARKAAAKNPQAEVVDPNARPLAPVFVAEGPVYGAPATASVVTLQARKPTSLIVRGADGSVYFARQLATGEAYRAPTLKGVTADVAEAGAIQAFVAGQNRGLLPVGLNSVTKLAATAPPPPAPVAAAPAAQPVSAAPR
jgi:cytoskeletal protein RodZ